MKPSSVMLPGLALFFALGLTACGGGGATTTMQASTTTMGQELIDLDESYKKGLITEKEYKKAKEAILDRYE
jgi:uncharacterized membrane protein